MALEEAKTGTFVVEASDGSQSWFPVATNQAVNGQVTFSDPTASESNHRIYRARIVP